MGVAGEVGGVPRHAQPIRTGSSLKRAWRSRRTLLSLAPLAALALLAALLSHRHVASRHRTARAASSAQDPSARPHHPV